MRRNAVLSTAALVASLVVLPTVAHADDAAALFDKGLAAMEAGKPAEGCPLLMKSYDLDPRAGTVFTLAECEVKWGKNAAALAHYREYLERFLKMPPTEQQRQKARQRIAETQIDSLEKTVPDISFVMAANAAEGTIVRVDGKVVPSITNVRMEPGEHTVTTEAPSGDKQEFKLTVVAGDKKRLELSPGLPPVAGGAPEPSSVGRPKEPKEPKEPEQPQPKPEQPRSGGGPGAGFWIAGGVGAAGLVVGTITGIMAMSKASTVDAHCLDVLCDAQGKKAAEDGKTLGWVSTIGFGVGVIGIGTAVVLLVTDTGSAKTAKAPAPAWTPVVAGTPGGGVVGAQGTF